MQTGQNSITPESSLPQLGQVRWGSVRMGLTSLQRRPRSTARQRSTKRREIGQHGSWQTIVPFHKQWCVTLYYSVKSHFGTEFLPLDIAAKRVVSQRQRYRQ
jgi:hypothetical protein